MSQVRTLRRWVLLSSIAIAACSGASDEARDAVRPETATAVSYLSPTAHLVRASTALRGIRPSVADLEAVRADPSKLEAIIDGYLDSPEFGETIRDLHNDSLLLRTPPRDYPFGFPSWPPLASKAQLVINRSLQEAPLRLIEHVVMNGRPYSEIVTADYTIANRIVAAVWGLEYSGNPGHDATYEDDSEWVVTKWADDRPAAGLLSDSGFYTRWTSNAVNANRSRANAVSKGLLCYDFLSREVIIDGSLNLADPEVVNNAVAENQACASCHQTLDPLAQHFRTFVVEPFGYLGFIQSKTNPNYPHRGIYGSTARGDTPGTKRTPGYFGMEAGDLGGVGRLIAADPRFSLCAAKRFYAYLAHVDLEKVPFELAAELQDTFVASGLDAKRLAKAVVWSDAFRVSHAETEEHGDVVGLKMMLPEQLSRLVFDLTGFRFRYLTDSTFGSPAAIDALDDPGDGLKVLAGGIDSYYVVRAAATANTTSTLVVADLASRAARFVVDADFAIAERSGRRIFTEIDPGESDEERIRAQLARIHLRLFGDFLDPHADEIDESVELLRSLSGVVGSEREAWATLLSALMQDSRVIYY
jgi:hypothetical protein